MSNAWQENQNLKKYVRVGESQFKGKKTAYLPKKKPDCKPVEEKVEGL